MSLPESKWIDKYLLRYGPPSVFGAFLLAFLYHKRRQLGLDFSLRLDRLELAAIFLFGGFLFAYIASAPVLALHYSRAIFLPKKYVKKARIWASITLVVTFALAECFFHFWWELDGVVSYFSSLAIAAWAQSAVGAAFAFLKRNEVFSFYTQLAAKRIGGNPDFIESYRTLREHGNAFFIIFWEIMLMLVLLAGMRKYTISGKDAVEALGFILAVCFAWIAPAVLAWHMAGYLESDFLERPEA